MKIVIISSLSDPETVELDPSTDFATFEMIIGSYVNIDPENLLIKKDGKIIKGESSSLIGNLGIKDGDVMYASIKPKQSINNPTTSSSGTFIDFSGINPNRLARNHNATPNRINLNPTTEQLRQKLLSLPADALGTYRAYNPQLFDHIHDAVKFQQLFEEQQRLMQSTNQELNQLYSADQLDPAVQARIEELIKKSNIDSQMEHAMEHNPESFAQTTMLYVDCRINQLAAKAFVDSGAQMTFISLSFARRCHVDHLIDTRWKGVARGVGTQHIVGRVHCVQLQIAGVFLTMSVSVLEDQEMDMLIGLDMLKRYQCSINLKRNVLEIGSVGVETPFLPESELPSHARLNNS